MKAYAVIETGGKQYRVSAEDKLRVESLPAEVGSRVVIDQVLAVSDGTKLTVGRPLVEAAEVAATVVDQVRGNKVVSFFKRRRKNSERKKGHRQELTVLQIESIKQ
ncbi:MAG: 50S ribosomal protein L21 [Lentisphaerae bacterium]|nr:50S ribosomal protein L21 [Lentisphaerota bacterium]